MQYFEDNRGPAKLFTLDKLGAKESDRVAADHRARIPPEKAATNRGDSGHPVRW